MTSKSTPSATTADAPTAADAIQPVAWRSQRRPKSPQTRKAARGNAGTSQTRAIIPRSAAHLMDFVDVDDRPVAVRREHDRAPDGVLAGGDHEDEDDEDAAPLVDGAVPPREGNERAARGLEHELDAEEDGNGSAAAGGGWR